MGAKGAVNAAQLAMLEPKVGSLPRALAGRSGRQIADTAAAAIMREFEGGAERGIIQCMVLGRLAAPRHPKTDNWLIETDFARLLVRPGVRLRDDNRQEHIGVPHGSFARLLLVDLQSEALEKGSREIAMERSASALVSRIGVARGGPTNGKWQINLNDYPPARWISRSVPTNRGSSLTSASLRPSVTLPSP